MVWISKLSIVIYISIDMESDDSINSELEQINYNNIINENDNSNSDESILSTFTNLGVGVRTPPRNINRNVRQRPENTGLVRTFNAYTDDYDDNLDPSLEYDFNAIDEIVGSEILGELFAEISSFYHEDNFQYFIEAIFSEIEDATKMLPNETKPYRNIIDYNDGQAIFGEGYDQMTKYDILNEIKEILKNHKDDNVNVLNQLIIDEIDERDRRSKQALRKKINAYNLRIDLFDRLIKKCENYRKRDYLEMDRQFFSIRGGKNKSKKNRKTNRKTKKQFLFNPNDPKKSFDVYIDKNPNDTIPIKYTTVKDVEDTIKKLENLYKTGKYPHKRIWQVGMIMKVRLEAMKKHKKKLYPKAKNVTKRFNLSNKYFKFLKKRSKESNNKTRKTMKFKI